ncbi:MAG: TetR/AcrR family transcriptional regulator [Bacteroidota bacterium]
MPKSVLFDREKVIEDVMQLFWKKGYNGTSMQDLVDVTGLNRSSFYNSFGDKFSLYEESIKHYQAKQLGMLNQTIQDAHSPLKAIQSLFKGILDEVRSGNRKGCMMTGCTSEMSHDPSVSDLLNANKENVVEIFKVLIEKAQGLGEISTEKDAATVALYLFSSLQGLRLTSMLESDLEGVIKEILARL